MKKSHAMAEIMALSGVQPVQKIIDIIKSIDNFKSDTIESLNMAKPYTEDGCIPIKEIFVDLTYQRKLRLQALINRLIEQGGFDKDVAGHIDVAVRIDGNYYVWDGFHRVIMAGIVGLTQIAASVYTHDKTLSVLDQQQKEAKMFKIRNADQTRMEPGEIFKSEVVFNEPTAMKILDLLKLCKIDVEGTNPGDGHYSLGGFAMLRNVWDKIPARYFSEASELIRNAWGSERTMSIYLWVGMAQLLQANESDRSVTTASVFELKDALTNYVENNSSKQKDFTQPRLHGLATESTATNILNRAFFDCYNDNGNEVKSLIKSLGVDEEELYTEQV
jgi:hypothetical protein